MGLNIEEIKRLVNENIPYNKVGEIFGVSGSYIRKVLKKSGFELPKRRKINPKENFNKGKVFNVKEDKRKKENGKFCVVCGEPLHGRQEMFCSKECKSKFYSENKYHTKYARKQDANGIKKKLEYVKKLGGKCSICGYNKNLSALVFHHVNPKEKKFSVDSRSMVRRAKSDVEAEVAKCILLCHNCHSELHHPEYNDLL